MKGIGHLSEKNLKERNKHIQEENRRELQKVPNTKYIFLMSKQFLFIFALSLVYQTKKIE